jgi:hypothetical protein
MSFRLLLKSAPGVFWISRRLIMVVGVIASGAFSLTSTDSCLAPSRSWKCRIEALPDETTTDCCAGANALTATVRCKRRPVLAETGTRPLRWL